MLFKSVNFLKKLTNPADLQLKKAHTLSMAVSPHIRRGTIYKLSENYKIRIFLLEFFTAASQHVKNNLFL